MAERNDDADNRRCFSELRRDHKNVIPVAGEQQLSNGVSEAWQARRCGKRFLFHR